jgi:predicted ribosomally synthesized peptide with SipW-like signal peptide
MKRNLILAVVVVAALVIAGTGGVFATWSDSETSMDNRIETGSVDLKVNGADDAPWGAGVPTKVNIDCMIPCKWYGPYEVELWHAGQCTQNASAFIHFKDVCCGNVLPKVNPYPDGGSALWPAGATTGYPDPVSGDLKPEPELVAEYGGKVNCKTVDGVGVLGDTCTMKSHVAVRVTADEEGLEEIIQETKIIDIECVEIYLFDLEPCHAQTIYLWFHLQQPTEEDFGLDYFADPGDPGFDELEWLKFNDWPSWALMKDLVTFSMEFDLWLEDP